MFAPILLLLFSLASPQCIPIKTDSELFEDLKAALSNKPVASGSFGQVFVAIMKSVTGDARLKVAIKKIKRNGSDNTRELKIFKAATIFDLSRAKGEKVTIWFPHYYDCYQDKLYTYIIMEAMGTDLTKQQVNYADKSLVHQMTIAKALVVDAYALNLAGYTHCDIKWENYMVTPKSETEVKMIDFGLAINPKEESCQGGTEGYMPPETNLSNEELLEEQADFRRAADVFALGIMLADLTDENCSTLLTNQEILDKNNYYSGYLKDALETAKHNIDHQIETAETIVETFIWTKFKSLVGTMLRKDARKRPLIKEVVGIITILKSLAIHYESFPDEKFVQKKHYKPLLEAWKDTKIKNAAQLARAISEIEDYFEKKIVI